MKFLRTKPTIYMFSALFFLIFTTHCNTAQFSGRSDTVGAPPSPASLPTSVTGNSPIAVSAICGKSLAVSLVLDVSGSMNSEKIAAVRDSANILLSSLGPTDLTALTVFNTDAKVLSPMGPNNAATIASLSTEAASMPGGNTGIASGLLAGYQQIKQNVTGDTMKILILLSDGENNSGDNPLTLDNQIKQSGDVTIFTIVSTGDISTILNGILGQNSISPLIADPLAAQGKALMAQLASSPQDYMEAQDQTALQQAFTNIRQTLCRTP